MIRELATRQVPIRTGKGSKEISTIEAILQILRAKAIKGDVRATALWERGRRAAGLQKTIADIDRKPMKLSRPLGDAFFVCTDETLQKDFQRFVAIAEYLGDNGEEEPVKGPESISAGDECATEGDLTGALDLYRTELARCQALIEDDQDNAAAQYDFRRALSRIALLANNALFRENFEDATAWASEALAAANHPKYSPPSWAGRKTVIQPLWIHIIRANSEMLAGRPSEARTFFMSFRRPDPKFRLVADWPDTIMLEFDRLRQAGLTHPLMQEVERYYFQIGRARNLIDWLPIPQSDSPWAEMIIEADQHVNVGDLDEANSLYRKAGDRCQTLETREARAQRMLIAYRIGRLAHEFLLVKKDQEALDCAEFALGSDPHSTAFNLRRAHALMYLKRVDEARAIYLSYRGKMLSYSYEASDLIIKKEFTQLRETGRPNRLMDDVERQYTSELWDQREVSSVTNVGSSAPIPETRITVRYKDVEPNPQNRDGLASAKTLMANGRWPEALLVAEGCFVKAVKLIEDKKGANLQAIDNRTEAIKLIMTIAIALADEGKITVALAALDRVLSEEPNTPNVTALRKQIMDKSDDFATDPTVSPGETQGMKTHNSPLS